MFRIELFLQENEGRFDRQKPMFLCQNPSFSKENRSETLCFIGRFRNENWMAFGPSFTGVSALEFIDSGVFL